MHGGGGMRGGSRPLPEGSDKPVDAQTFRRVVQFFRPYWKRVVVTIIAILITAALGLVNPYLLRAIIDDAIPSGDLSRLYWMVGLMIAVPIFSSLIGVGQTYLNVVIGQGVMRDLRDALYQHLQKQSLRFFTATRTGEIQSRISNDVGGVQRVVTETATSVVSNIAVAGTTVVKSAI